VSGSGDADLIGYLNHILSDPIPRPQRSAYWREQRRGSDQGAVTTTNCAASLVFIVSCLWIEGNYFKDLIQ